MRSYSEYRNLPADVISTVTNAARSGDLKYFVAVALNERPKILSLRDSKGYSALMLACYHGQTDLVRALLEWGADPNDKDFGGNSVLMGATFKSHIDVVKLLLFYGADPGLANNKGQTASLFAQMFGRTEVLALLEPESKSNLKEKLKSWVSFFKLNLNNERNSNV